MEKTNKEFDVSTIIISLEEYCKYIQPCRIKHTNSGSNGLIPHATIIYPFLRTKEKYDLERSKVQGICNNIHSFTLEFDSLGRFEETGVLFIKPKLSVDYTSVVKMFLSAFPEIKPYDGNFPVDQLRPHITVAIEKDVEKLNRIEDDFKKEFKKMKHHKMKVKEFMVSVKSGDPWYEYDRLILNKKEI